MKQPRDLALRYLALADRDIKTCRQLSDIFDSHDEAIGFHAQKQSKNVLSRSCWESDPIQKNARLGGTRRSPKRSLATHASPR